MTIGLTCLLDHYYVFVGNYNGTGEYNGDGGRGYVGRGRGRARARFFRSRGRGRGYGGQSGGYYDYGDLEVPPAQGRGKFVEWCFLSSTIFTPLE